MQSICDFVHSHITFGYQDADATRGAARGFTEQRGVCRDFAHLAVTFCRCNARHNVPRIGRILIARGRDAADVAISTTFGQTSLKSFVVTTREVEQEVSNNWVEGGIGSEALMNCLHVRHGSRLAD